MGCSFGDPVEHAAMLETASVRRSVTHGLSIAGHRGFHD